MATDQKVKEQRLMRMTPAWYACDGPGLARLAGAGLGWLAQNVQIVDELNVFPVPDGDTGGNMLATMKNAWDELADDTPDDVGSVTASIAKGAMMGSRGNSGVILARLWQGCADALEGEQTCDSDKLVVAMRRASEFADNVRGMKPVEGTILTVARDGAKAAEEAAAQTKDLRLILEAVVAEMHRSVKRTPDLLVKDGVYVLRDAGVVDAGGMGLAFIMEGMLRYLNGEPVEIDGHEFSVQSGGERMDGQIDLSGLDYPYDVQFIIQGENLDLDEITETIEDMGDSALVMGDSETVKVHVHVVNPGEPLGYAAGLGALDDVVVENMAAQYENFRKAREGTASDLPRVEAPEVQAGDVAAVAVVPGEGLARVFYSLGAARVISGGQTMNPSTEELVEAVESLPTDKVVLLPNNKNILMAAQQCAEYVTDKQVRVVASSTIPQGISALLALETVGATGGIDDVAGAMSEALGHVQTGEITRATRKATINGVRVKKGQLIGLHENDLRMAGDAMEEVMEALLAEMGADKLELVTLYYGEGVTPGEAEAMAEVMRVRFGGQEFEVVEGGQAHYPYVLSAE